MERLLRTSAGENSEEVSSSYSYGLSGSSAPPTTPREFVRPHLSTISHQSAEAVRDAEAEVTDDAVNDVTMLRHDLTQSSLEEKDVEVDTLKKEVESLNGFQQDDYPNSEDQQDEEEEPLPLSLPPEDEGEEEEEEDVGEVGEMKEERMTAAGVVVMEEPQLAPNVEVFELGGESSEDSLSPEDDAQALFIKESQYKNAVAEAEIAKLKAKVSLCELRTLLSWRNS